MLCWHIDFSILGGLLMVGGLYGVLWGKNKERALCQVSIEEGKPAHAGEGRNMAWTILMLFLLRNMKEILVLKKSKSWKCYQMKSAAKFWVHVDQPNSHGLWIKTVKNFVFCTDSYKNAIVKNILPRASTSPVGV